jgi:transcriptional regulator GlxA family with amidase domain
VPFPSAKIAKPALFNHTLLHYTLLKMNHIAVPKETERRVIMLLLPEVNLLDLGGPAQVFQVAQHYGAPYELLFCAASEKIVSSLGLSLGPLGPLPVPQKDDLILIPGPRLKPPSSNQPWIAANVRNWLRRAYATGAQLASVCTGAVALGEAGLLDERRCTTHWELIGAMQARYPKALVQHAVLYTHDGPITTSAGIASGIDMALSLLERDHGPQFTAQVARYLVVYLRRDGTESQTSVYLEYRTHLHPSVHLIQDYLCQHASHKTSLNTLATLAKMSPRGLTKAFKQHTGLTPLAYQRMLRFELATQLMNNPSMTLEAIAEQCGFEDSRHFRRLWNMHYGVTPSDTREFMNRS